MPSRTLVWCECPEVAASDSDVHFVVPVVDYGAEKPTSMVVHKPALLLVRRVRQVGLPFLPVGNVVLGVERDQVSRCLATSLKLEYCVVNVCALRELLFRGLTQSII